MPRPWAKLYGSLQNHPKYLRMSIEDRAGWLTLFLSTINATDPDDLGTRQDVLAILAAGGHREPGFILDRLIALVLVDVDARRHGLHAWHDYQPDDPTGARRQRDARDRKRTADRASRDSHVTNRPRAADSVLVSRDNSRDVTHKRRGEEIFLEGGAGSVAREAKLPRDSEAQLGDGTKPLPTDKELVAGVLPTDEQMAQLHDDAILVENLEAVRRVFGDDLTPASIALADAAIARTTVDPDDVDDFDKGWKTGTLPW